MLWQAATYRGLDRFVLIIIWGPNISQSAATIIVVLPALLNYETTRGIQLLVHWGLVLYTRFPLRNLIVFLRLLLLLFVWVLFWIKNTTHYKTKTKTKACIKQNQILLALSSFSFLKFCECLVIRGELQGFFPGNLAGDKLGLGLVIFGPGSLLPFKDLFSLFCFLDLIVLLWSMVEYCKGEYAGFGRRIGWWLFFFRTE